MIWQIGDRSPRGRRRFRRSLDGLLPIALLLLFSGSNLAQDFHLLRSGIMYAAMKHYVGPDPERIHLLLLDPSLVRLDVVHADDLAIGTETTSSIAARKGAFAAINAGFFRLDGSGFAGDASGLLKIDGKILSESMNDRIALGIKNGENATNIFFEHVKTESYFVRRIDDRFLLSGINRERKVNEIVVYTPEFGKTTPANNEGFELVVKKRISDGITRTGGNTAIPADGMVFSFGSKAFANNDAGLRRLTNGRQVIRFEIRIVSPDKDDIFKFAESEDIVAGVPLLIRDGKINITWEQEKASRAFAENRHPRTAIAKMKDERILLITVDGRQPGVSHGMTLRELAEFLISLGAVDAMNLDGGGSTTMFVDGKVVNTPSDAGGERKVSDAIIVTTRNKNARPLLKRRNPR